MMAMISRGPHADPVALVVCILRGSACPHTFTERRRGAQRFARHASGGSV